MDWMKRAWNGQERLWRVFWIYSFLIGIVLGIINFALIFTIGVAASKAFSAFQIVYWIFTAVSGWRCAFNVSWRGWGYIVRFLIIFGAIGQIFNVYSIFFSSSAPFPELKGNSAFTMKMNNKMMPGSHMGANAMVVIPNAANGGGNHSSVVVLPAATPTVPVAPVASAPTPSPVAASAAPVAVSNQDKYKAECEQYMGDYAKKNGADPQQYIAKNQAYLQQCIQVYMSKDTAANKAR